MHPEANTRGARVPVPVLESGTSSAENHSSELTPAQLGVARVMRRLSPRACATLALEAGLEVPSQSPAPQEPAEAPSVPGSPCGDGAPEVLRGRRDRRRAARSGKAEARESRARARAREVQTQAQARAAEARARAFEAFEARERVELGADELDALDELADAYGRPIPQPVWVMCRRIVRSRSPERTAQMWLRQAGRRFSAVELGQIVEAALCPDGRGGYRYSWRDVSARRFLAVGLAELRLGVEVPGARGPRVCMRGVSRGALQEMMRDADGSAPCMTWISGDASQHGRRARAAGAHKGEKPLHHLGLLRRLVRVGFVRKVQLPAQAATVEAFEQRPDRVGVLRCINRYYLHGREWAARAGAAVVDALTELARVACELPIRRAPRTAAERLYAEKRGRARAPD